jgi:ligand-binding sensor domain-containing protein
MFLNFFLNLTKGSLLTQRIFYILIMSILCATKSLSQTQAFYPVQRLNLSDSIVNEHITCIAEDDKGQLWLGTTQGLFQYNGKNLKRFTFDARNPNSISGNHILSLHFDSVHKALWIGTNGNGMSKFDLTTEKITRFRIENGTQILHKDNAYWSIKKINSKQLVLASAGGGIKVFDIDKEAFNKEKLYSNLPKSDVRCIANGPLGVFWVGTFQDGLCYLNTKSNTCISFPKLKALGLNQILSLYYDEQQEILWIGTQFNGLWKYSKQKNSFQKVLDLPKERILSLEIRTKYPNEVWMSSSSGIKLYNTKHQQLYDEPLLKTQENIDLSKITSLFKDKRENLWFGVLNQGLYGIPPGLAPIVNSKALGIKIKGKVIDIENWGDSLLILTDSNQLILKNTQNNSLSYLKAPESSPRFLFKETQNNHVFIGTKEGLFQLNTQSSKFTRIELPFPKELSKKISLSCGLKDSRGVLWLGTDSSGLFRFSPETTLLNQFKPSISLNSLSDSAINLIYEDTQGRVWIGTKNNGLALFNRFAETFIRVPDFKGTVLDFKDLGDNIYTIVSDKALLTFHYDGTTFSTIEQLQAEHIKSPKAIQYYNSAIWVSDATGLYAIKFENNGFNKVQKVGHNLIQQLRFTSGSSYKLNKELLFGAEQDLILFNPDSIGFTRIFYPVVLEGLSVNNQAVKIQESNKTSFRFDRDSGSIRYPYLDTLQFLFGTENIGSHRNIHYIPKGYHSFG